MTIVGLAMRDSRISPPANINMVSDLPEPWVCQITPPATVARAGGRLEMSKHADARLAQRAELVVARDPLVDLAPLVLLEGDTGAQVVDQRSRIEQATDQRLQGRSAATLAIVDRAPGHEAAASAGDRADAGQHAVRDDQHQVRHEQVGGGPHVAVELADGYAQIRFVAGRILEFDYRDWQAVQKDCQIRADVRPQRTGYGELTHDQQVVRHRVLEIDKAGKPAAYLTAGRVGIFDLETVGEQSVEPPVVLDERRMRWVRDNTHDFFYCVIRKDRIQAVNRSLKAALHDALRRVALACIVDFHAAPDRYTQGAEVY